MFLQMRSTIPIAGSLLALAALACADATAPSAQAEDWELQADSRADVVCADVALAGEGPLGIIPAGYEGAGGFGAPPAPTTIAGLAGTLHSYVTSDLTPTGANAQGVGHITLVHVFTSGGDSFHTSDRATCGPTPGSPGTCRLSDQMTIVEGTGAFEGATGKIHNRGVLDFIQFKLTFEAKGTVCGSGL